MNLQPQLENENILLVPLEEEDLGALYHVASDPLIWEQHPKKDRYQIDSFKIFFEEAIDSKGAFKIIDKKQNIIIGSSRYYDLDLEDKSILIGYTFLSRDYWGSLYNSQIKKLMLDYAFEYLDKVYFTVGALNIRSQKAIEKIGGIKNKEFSVFYDNQPDVLKFQYVIEKSIWLKNIL
ncbi:GNAT family N-acetyltransferase [Flavobacterium davisii]|uniref:GNAT family N-acetyltransferase n=1 Tax=Flavobacterium davisii TaxID=2906077 RepID=UPI0035D02DD4